MEYAGNQLYCNYIDTTDKISLTESDEMGFFHCKRDAKSGKATFCVRPESTLLHRLQPNELDKNVFKGTVSKIFDRGLMFQSNININDDFLVVNLTMRKRFLDLGLDVGSTVYISFDEKNVHIIDNKTDSIISTVG
jgi:ABC-type sugar transport system ATPase subunit